MNRFPQLFLSLLWRPAWALREIAGSASLAFSAVTAWIFSAFYMISAELLASFAQATKALPSGETIVKEASFFNPAWASLIPGVLTRSLLIVLFVALLYAPLLILIGNLFDRRESFSLALRENYGSTASCALSSLAMSLLITMLPAAVITWQSTKLAGNSLLGYLILLVAMPIPIFAAYIVITLRTVFRMGWGLASASTLVSFLSLFALPIMTQLFNFVCASPFLMILLYFLFRDRFGGIFDAQRSRQAFKQNLEAATLNPSDASAHYNLGLVYQQRGDLEAAEASFRRAVEIDSDETDAHYQLGRISRERGNLSEAINHFSTVVKQNPGYSQQEIWREIAQTYLTARQYDDALKMLDRFLAERPSDAQARYLRGQALAGLNRSAEAEAEMHNCIDAVRTAPAYKYRREQRWLRLAEQFLKDKGASSRA